MKIIIRAPNWLGDLMMSTAFMKAVLDLYPAASVDLIVKKGFEELPLPRRGQIFVYDKAVTSPGLFGHALRDNAYDVFFVLPPSFSSAWMAFKSRAARRIGYAFPFRNMLLTEPKNFSSEPRSRHIVDEYLDLLGPSLRKEQYAPSLNVDAAWMESHWPAWFQEKAPYVLIAPGATFGPAKMWPLDHYRALVAGLKKKGLKIFVVGTQSERALGENISDRNETENLCGRLTINQLVALMKKTSLLVSNDSGPMHVAAAVGIPQVALFGSSSPTWTAPINPLAKVISLHLDCSPCFRRVCPLGHTNCLVKMDPDRVLNQALSLLSPAPGVL